MSADAARVPVHADEVRVLEGPNLYFPRPAVKVTLSLPGLLDAGREDAERVWRELGMRRGAIGRPGSGTRQRIGLKIVEQVVRVLAGTIGTTRLGVRSRAGSRPDQVVVAFVWRRRGRARALGEAIAPVLAGLLAGSSLPEVLEGRAEAIAREPDGEPPRIVTPTVPVASVTGTNGKTTTTRLLAHIGMISGRRTAWSSTDGVLAQGELIEAGDYSGPAGARMVLSAPGVQLGILETARGGMLLKGLGVSHNDVSVVTNVTADHLGSHGIDTVDQLAEVKAIVAHATRSGGWAVLNGDDPRVWAMRAGIRAKPWVFTLDPNSPAIRESLDAGGRAITVLDGRVTVFAGGRIDPLVRIVDVPMTLSGLSRHNIANALAGAAAALALGIEREFVVEGLRSFVPDERLNPGRMNVYTLPHAEGGLTVIVDLAHNEAGLEALLDVAQGLVAPGGRVHLSLGTAGDRTDEILQSLGEIAGRRADHVVIAHKEHYLRGRTHADMGHQFHVGLAWAGVAAVDSHPTELASLRALVESAAPGDVIAVMCHSERAEIREWLGEQGASPDDARAIRRKVVAARGEHEAEEEITALWRLAEPAARVSAAEELHAAHPEDPRITYEYASALDSAGAEQAAVPLYEVALGAGLPEPHAHRARIQLASSLRLLGRASEALEQLDEVLATHPESVGARGFRALVLRDLGRSDEAVSELLAVITSTSTDTDVEHYRVALAQYAHG